MTKSIMKNKLLIVEDDLENQSLFKLILSRHYEVEFSDCDKSFYSKLASKDFDLIIMDITLKEGKSGLELTKEIKHSKVFSTIPVLCMSAHVFEQDKRAALRAGVDAYLEKPVPHKILLETIQRLIEKAASQKS